ncbi:MAG: serine/threonine protein kinase [Planctomycetes bacterium]|nr:serine/threonine protein kinase [Planctomycetota bacterium]
MPENEEVLLGQLAVKRGFISREELEEALAEQERLKTEDIHKHLGEVLIDLNLLTKKQADRLLEEQRERAGAARRIGHFEVYAKLGEGGMGAVYLAKMMGPAVKGGDVRGFPENPEEGPLVALKVLPPKLARDESFLTRFRREVEVLSRMNHPNIVRAVDWGRADGLHFLAMEFVQGENSYQKVSRDGPLDERDAITLALEMARALQYASEKDILHRDVKPENVLIDLSGVTHLTDFGLVSTTGSKEDAGVTNHGTTVGTPYYISPEQAQGAADVDTRSDLYSLGATLFHLLTGEVPYDGESAPVIMTKHVVDPVPDPLKIRPRLSPALAAVIMKLMAKAPKDRYQAPNDLIDDLQRIWRGESPLHVRVPKAPEKKSGGDRNRGSASLRRSGATRARTTASRSRIRSTAGYQFTAVAALLVLAGAGWYLYQRRNAGGSAGELPPVPVSAVPSTGIETFDDATASPPEPFQPEPSDPEPPDAPPRVHRPASVPSDTRVHDVPLTYGQYTKTCRAVSNSGEERRAARAIMHEDYEGSDRLRIIAMSENPPLMARAQPEDFLRISYLARGTGEKLRVSMSTAADGITYIMRAAYVDVNADGEWHDQQFLLRLVGQLPNEPLTDITLFVPVKERNAEFYLSDMQVLSSKPAPWSYSIDGRSLAGAVGWSYRDGMCTSDRNGSFLELTCTRPAHVIYLKMALFLVGDDDSYLTVHPDGSDTVSRASLQGLGRVSGTIREVDLPTSMTGSIRIESHLRSGGRIGIGRIVIYEGR